MSQVATVLYSLKGRVTFISSFTTFPHSGGVIISKALFTICSSKHYETVNWCLSNELVCAHTRNISLLEALFHLPNMSALSLHFEEWSQERKSAIFQIWSYVMKKHIRTKFEVVDIKNRSEMITWEMIKFYAFNPITLNFDVWTRESIQPGSCHFPEIQWTCKRFEMQFVCDRVNTYYNKTPVAGGWRHVAEWLNRDSPIHLPRRIQSSLITIYFSQ